MKKLIYAIILLCAIFSNGITAFAGSIPEDLLGDDKSLVFFGEVVSYNADESITVLPTQKIKGDVKVGTELSYNYVVPMGNFSIEKGEAYLFGYYNKINPLYVFHTTSTDTKTLRILDKSGGGIEERMQDYLNSGAFEEAEIKRLEKLNSAVPSVTDNTEPLQNAEADSIRWTPWIIAFFAALALITLAATYIRKKL